MLSQMTFKRMKAMLSQAKIDCESNTDEQALDVKELYPSWESKEIGYQFTLDERVYYAENDTLYKVIQPHAKQMDWTPDAAVSLFVKISIEEYPEWVQPTGAHDAYALGAKVSHNDAHWVSLIDANVYEPSVAVPTLWQKEV